MAQLSMLLDAPITKVRRASIRTDQRHSDEMVVGWLLELEGGDVIYLFSSRAIKNRPRFSPWHMMKHQRRRSWRRKSNAAVDTAPRTAG